MKVSLVRLQCLSLLLSFIPCLVFGKIEQIKEKLAETHADVTKLKGKDVPEFIHHKRLFVEQIKLRRTEHRNAIDSIKNIEKGSQRGFLEDVHPGISKLLSEARLSFEKVRFEPKDNFPFDRPELKDALSKLIENIAFFSDLATNFPKFFEPKMRKNQKLRTIIVWAFNFAKETGLYDEATLQKMTEMAEQYSIVEKTDKSETTTVPPNSLENAKEAAQKELAKKRAEKTKDKKPIKKAAKGEL